jgi:hypothetical protein
MSSLNIIKKVSVHKKNFVKVLLKRSRPLMLLLLTKSPMRRKGRALNIM